MKLTLVILAPTVAVAAQAADFLPSRQKIGVYRFFALLQEEPMRPTPFLAKDDVKFALGDGDEAMGVRAGVLLSQTSWGFLVCHAATLPTEKEVESAVAALKAGEAWRSSLLWGATREWLIAEGFAPLLPETATINEDVEPTSRPTAPPSRSIPSGVNEDAREMAACIAGRPAKLPTVIAALREVANLSSFWTDPKSLGNEWEKVVAAQVRREYPAAESATLAGAVFLGSSAEETALRVQSAELASHPAQIWLFIGPRNEPWAAPLAARAAHATLHLEGTGNRRLVCFAPSTLAALFNGASDQ